MDLEQLIACAIRVRDSADEFACARAAIEAIEGAGYVIIPGKKLKAPLGYDKDGRIIELPKH